MARQWVSGYLGIIGDSSVPTNTTEGSKWVEMVLDEEKSGNYSRYLDTC